MSASPKPRRSPVPTGTITFMFTDVEGSTALWEARPDEMKEAIAAHDHILQSVIAAHGGYVFSTAGDGVGAAFARPEEALTAAVETQCALGFHPWPSGFGVRIRIGIHSGSADERGGDYFGPVVNRAARVMDAGHGGQVLVSLAAEQLMRDRLPLGVNLADLGEHRLRDLQRPEHLFQVETEGLPRQFPPPRTLDAVPNNLPAQLSSFVGRERELAQLARLLEDHRLVTLTGIGGAGKTRLALQYAAEASERFPDGVHFVELATLVDPKLVVSRVAVAASVPSSQGGTEDVDADLMLLAACLRDERMLLVLDNCEHVIESAARVAERLLAACPLLTVVATSREALGIDGEQALRVPPLGLPHDTVSLTAGELLTFESARLLMERARSADPDFDISGEDVPAVAEICRRLDGIPLALELVAARLVSLSPAGVMKHLDDQFSLLTAGRRTAVERHQTLRAAIDWSFDLLSVDARTLLPRLGVFTGGWTLDAAQAVAGDEALGSLAIVDAMSELVEKSIVVVDRSDAAGRYRMGEPMRQYAIERLVASGGLTTFRDRHAAWVEDLLGLSAYLDWVALNGDLDALLLSVMEYTNGVEAVRQLVARGAGDAAGRILGGMYLAVMATGQAREGLQLADAVLALDDLQDWVRYLVHSFSGLYSYFLGDFNGARARLDRATVFGKASPGVPSTYASSFFAATIRSTLSGMLELTDEIRALTTEALAEGNDTMAGLATFLLAFAAMEEDDKERAVVLFHSAYERVKHVPVGVAPYALAFTGYLKALAGHPDADEIVAQGEMLARGVGDPMAIAWTLVARIALEPLGKAQSVFVEAFRITRRHGVGMWVCLEAGALLAEKRRDDRNLARVLGAQAAHLGDVPAFAQWQQWMATARARLGADAFADHFAAGARDGPEVVLDALLVPPPRA